ncbi:6,7-dimethyl-8-ribityllumazine synthase [Schizophyllum amplum]|uniref:6,7-dimethyl-8-ribityllumazine synthase n=1 Tax=Schizophyllum amplum TaxID=97359 RepID=A0A550C1G2_9AGAR|nr:6,7-dimethyl-8-ribityllumazine synthase [Auriculariopsis ampla]
MAPTAKALPEALSVSPETASSLRIAIVHARWNAEIIASLLDGAVNKLKAAGVKEQNIIVQSVPGSFELPLACSRVIQGSHVQAASNANNVDLLGGLTFGGSRSGTPIPPGSAQSLASAPAKQPFDAVIAIGVLIKGSTMHFEYISDAVSHGLMRVQLETGVPVIFGVLTALTDAQAESRAGIVPKGAPAGMAAHNHGDDWGQAALEMAVQARNWKEGRFL